MKQLLIIKDYETGETLEYLLTDDVESAADIYNSYIDPMSLSLDEKIKELIKECRKQNIKIDYCEKIKKVYC